MQKKFNLIQNLIFVRFLGRIVMNVKKRVYTSIGTKMYKTIYLKKKY